MSKIPSPVERIAHTDDIAHSLQIAHNQSREARNYNQALLKYAEIITAIAETGTLGDKMDAEIALQARDLRKAQDMKPEFVKQAQDGIANFKAALLVYDKLTARPAEYRRHAEEFLPKEKPHGIPVDSMRKALASQNSREGNRDTSVNDLPGEEALFAARKALLSAIAREYKQVQEIVMAGGNPPPGSKRSSAS